MASTKIKKTDSDNYIGNFSLTIKGITKGISVPFTFSVMNNVYALKGAFSINRLDFKLGEKSIILSNNVKINIEFKGQPQ